LILKTRKILTVLYATHRKKTYSKSCDGTATKETGEKNYEKPLKVVGKPKVSIAVFCHFNGGGGDNVSMATFIPQLKKATPENDVISEGRSLTCTSCHKN